MRARAGHTKFATDALLAEYDPTFVFSCYQIHGKPDAAARCRARRFWLARGYEQVTMHMPEMRQSRHVLHVPREEGAQLPVSRARALIRWLGRRPDRARDRRCSPCVHASTSSRRARLVHVVAETSDPPGTHRPGRLARVIARGGPVIVGFVADGIGRARRSPVTSSRGRGVVKDRIILPAGPTAIRFAAPRDAQPRVEPGRPSRRSRVSAGELAVARAARDRDVRAPPGTARGDGVFALALLADRRRHRADARAPSARAGSRARRGSRWARVFAVAVVARWIDLGGFGQTWDEDVNWAAGRNYITNLLALDVRAQVLAAGTSSTRR